VFEKYMWVFPIIISLIIIILLLISCTIINVESSDGAEIEVGVLTDAEAANVK